MDFTQPWHSGDVTFIVEGRSIHANKGVLSMSSEVFRAMFTSDFKEKQMTEIPLPGKKFADMLQLMQILQPLSEKPIDNSNAEILVRLADEYQIQPVVERCEKVLVKQPPSIHNLLLADKFCLTALRKVFLRSMKDVPISKIQNDPEFGKIDKKTRADIFEHHAMYQQPSIKNFFLAVKHNVSEVYDRCMQYMKDTPLPQLKAETCFKDLKPETLNEVLYYKNARLEALRAKVGSVVGWQMLEVWFECPGTKCKDDSHYMGSSRQCPDCKMGRFDVICDIMKKY